MKTNLSSEDMAENSQPAADVDQTASTSPDASSVAQINDDDYDYLFKVVLIGDSGVGKSNLL